MIGITSFGAYVPRLRLSRQTAVDALHRPSPDIAAKQSGERSVCSFDEDTLTMAHSASRACLEGCERTAVEGTYLCSTTLPFADRQNAGMLKTALGLGDRFQTADFTGSLRAGTTGLLAALNAVKAGTAQTVLVAASDHRLARPGSPDELFQGDGAAAVLVGASNPVAEYLGGISISRDLADHYRMSKGTFDYHWEERWAVDTTMVPIVKEALAVLLEELKLRMTDIDIFVIPAPTPSIHARMLRAVGIPAERAADHLLDSVGDTGAAHPLLMTAAALESATAGKTLVCLGVGSGADALCFRTPTSAPGRPTPCGVSRTLHNRVPLPHYAKFLAFRGLITVDQGIRGEIQTKTALSVLHRAQDLLLQLSGGKCTDCGTPQFPKSRICVHPACGKADTQTDYIFSDLKASIRTYTGDFLLPCPDPPALYGLIQFDGGGRMHAEFCDCTLDELAVGERVHMVFRKRYEDEERGFVGYFWKATPIRDIGRLP